MLAVLITAASCGSTAAAAAVPTIVDPGAVAPLPPTVPTAPTTVPATAPATGVAPTARAAEPKPTCTLEVLSNRLGPVVAGDLPAPAAGVLRFAVRCNQDAQVSMAGQVKKRRGHRRTLALPPVGGHAVANVPLILQTRLPRAALAGLRHRARESATFTLTAVNPNGTDTASAAILRLKALAAN